MATKIKIAASYFYQPSDKLKAYIEEAKDRCWQPTAMIL